MRLWGTLLLLLFVVGCTDTPASEFGTFEQIEQNDGNCEEVVFTEYFVKPSYVQKVGQIGVVHGSGKFTVGRSYVSFKEDLGLLKIPVYAPTKLILSQGSHYQDPSAIGVEGYLSDYALTFNAGCGVTVTFAHLKEVVDSIGNQLQEVKSDSRTIQLDPIEFEAGDLIGYFVQNAGVTGIDIMVHDDNVVNQFANQARQEIGHGTNLLHAVCPYDFYTDDKKEDYYNLIGGASGTLFEVKECGPISREFPGTISGLWFLDKEVSDTSDYYTDYYKDGDYGSVLPIVGDEEGITIGGLGDSAIERVYTNNPTYIAPKDVTGEHCYKISTYSPNDDAGYVYFKLIDDETMDVFYSRAGSCPSGFPDGEKRYYR